MTDPMAARDGLIGRMRQQFEELHGHPPDAKASREIQQAAQHVAEVAGRRNEIARYKPRRTR